MAAHPYWRILCTDSPGGIYAAFAEVEMRPSAGGADQCAGGVATADSAYSVSYPASKAFDDDLSTMWHSGGGFPHWIKYAFPAAVDVPVLALTARTSENQVTPTAFSLQWSDDDVNWTTLWSISGLDRWLSSERRVFIWDGTTVKSDHTYLRVNTQYAYVVAKGTRSVRVNQNYAYVVARGGRGVKVNQQYAYVIARVAVLPPDPGGGEGGGAARIRAAQIIG